jgi:superfamily II DNA/RNA helicase
LASGDWYAGDVRYLVVDEADTLFDAGFGPDIEALLVPILAVGGQVLLVTATLTKDVERLLAARLPGVRRCATSSLHKAVQGARHRFLDVPGDADKLDLLRQLLAQEGGRSSGSDQGLPRTMVFCNTLSSCRAVEHALAEAGLQTVSYHGEMTTEDRQASLARFTEDGEEAAAPPVMVCTDLAARGLDFGCSVAHVVMFDFPLNPVDYLHRTGRTARAGATGRITSLCAKRDRVLAQQIEDSVRRGGSLDSLSSNRATVRSLGIAADVPLTPSAPG